MNIVSGGGWPDRGGLATHWSACISKTCSCLCPFLFLKIASPREAVSCQLERFFKMPKHHNIKNVKIYTIQRHCGQEDMGTGTGSGEHWSVVLTGAGLTERRGCL